MDLSASSQGKSTRKASQAPAHKGALMSTNDNDPNDRPTPVPDVDAHGHAALLLVESLIHGLCENATLTSAQAAEIAERALEVQLEYAEATRNTLSSMHRAQLLLRDIAASLNIDRPDDGGID